MSAKLITIKNANVTLHGEGTHFHALKNIDFCLKTGEHIAILGPNGAGKSTFLRTLSGEQWIDTGMGIDQDTGSITWNYEGKAESSPIMARRVTALVSCAQQEQYTRNAWQLSGADILLTAFGSLPDAMTQTEGQQKELVQNMAEQLACTGLLNITAHALSQGQLRLLLLGRALLKKPRVLLLDEYLDGLDASSRTNIINILEQISAHTSLVISTHRTQSLIPCISKTLYIHEGKLSQNPVNIQQNTHTSNTASIITTGTATTNTKPVIAVRNATVFVERTPVLKNINWELHAGEHWMIQGKNGAGKSTFLRLLAGDEYPAVGGTIKRHFARLYPQEDNTTSLSHIRHAVRLVSDYEQACYGYDLTGLEFVLSGIDNVIGTYREFNQDEVQNAAMHLQSFGLNSLENRRIRSLSTGQLRRLFIARALMAKPEVLLLDEPFSGLDTSSRNKCMDSLDNLSASVCIVLVSHHKEDYLPVINREARFENGRIIL